MKQVIVGLGEALWDCLPEGKRLVVHRQTLLIMLVSSVMTLLLSVL